MNREMWHRQALNNRKNVAVITVLIITQEWLHMASRQCAVIIAPSEAFLGGKAKLKKAGSLGAQLPEASVYSFSYQFPSTFKTKLSKNANYTTCTSLVYIKMHVSQGTCT